MFCSNCGTQLPDEAMFCSKCGKSLKPTAQVGPTPEKWEICEIMLDKRNELAAGAIYWFYASALGPNGEYSAGESPDVAIGSRFFNYPKNNDKKAITAHETLVKDLMAYNWESVQSSGTNWWASKFRRKIAGHYSSGARWITCEISHEIVKKGWSSGEVKFKAILDGGKDSIAESAVFTASTIPFDKEKAKRDNGLFSAYNNLVQKLTADGWLCFGKNKFWFNERFRKPLD